MTFCLLLCLKVEIIFLMWLQNNFIMTISIKQVGGFFSLNPG